MGLLARYRDRFGFRLYHDCLLGNHFHLRPQLPDARLLSRLVAGLLVAYGHHYRRRCGPVGHLFQGRFRSPAVETERYLLSCGRYVERNPVEAGLVGEPWQYRLSNCRAYALGEADPLLAVNPWYEELAAESGRRQELWRAFLLGAAPKEAAVRRDDWVVGEASYRARLQQSADRPMPSGRGRLRRPGTAPLSRVALPIQIGPPVAGSAACGFSRRKTSRV